MIVHTFVLDQSSLPIHLLIVSFSYHHWGVDHPPFVSKCRWIGSLVVTFSSLSAWNRTEHSRIYKRKCSRNTTSKLRKCTAQYKTSRNHRLINFFRANQYVLQFRKWDWKKNITQAEWYILAKRSPFDKKQGSLARFFSMESFCRKQRSRRRCQDISSSIDQDRQVHDLIHSIPFSTSFLTSAI